MSKATAFDTFRLSYVLILLGADVHLFFDELVQRYEGLCFGNPRNVLQGIDEDVH